MHSTKRIEKYLRLRVEQCGGALRIPRGGKRRNKYTWDGKTLIPHTRTYEDLAHDVAHLLIATPKEQECVEFGLGPDPAHYSDAEPKYGQKRCDRIEADACDINLCLCQVLGLSVGSMARYLSAPMLKPRNVKRLRKKYEYVFNKEEWAAIELAARDDTWHDSEATMIRGWHCRY